MRKIRAAWDRAHATVSRYLPEHQIYFRTNGNVRFVTVSTRAQVMAVAACALVIGWLGVASSSFWTQTDAIADKQRVVAMQERQLAAMQMRMKVLTSDIKELRQDAQITSQRIEQRHAFLNQLISNRLQVNEKTAKPIAVSQRDSLTQALRAGQNATREQKALVQAYQSLEREQLAFVDQATTATQARYEELTRLVTRLGLSADQMIAQSHRGMGGPLIRASFERGAYSTLEPRFKDLYMSWTRLDLLQRAMLSIPAYLPTRNTTFTSGFGFRYDPFSGSPAMHAGIDFAGPLGTPIMAAASGVVVKATWLGGYGNMIEIDHGRGLTTRYAHLATMAVREGDRVEQGDVIAGMGSTGRSTGVHLHYEIRVNGEAVNPMPFLEAARDVLEVQRIVDSGAPIEDPAG